MSGSHTQALVAKISRHMLVIFNVYNSKQALPSRKTHEVLNPPNKEKGFRRNTTPCLKKVSIVDSAQKSQNFFFFFFNSTSHLSLSLLNSLLQIWMGWGGGTISMPGD